MAVSLEDRLARLPQDHRAEVDARAAELIAEELTLRELRRALDRTQVALANQLGVKQETISRLEKTQRHAAVDVAQLCRGQGR